MRQPLGNAIRSLRWQSRENILQVGIWIMSVKSRRLDQTHDRSRRFSLRSDPENNRFERPRAHGRIWLSGSQTRLPASNP